jgi:hypothetical protein
MLPPGVARCLQALSVATLALAVGTAAAVPPAAPPAPKQYDVHIRYRIDAGRPERLKQYFELTKFLTSAGFTVDPNLDDDPGDPYETRLRGTIASANVPLLFADPQTRRTFADPRIRSLLLLPAGFKIPEDAAAPVKVQLGLAGGLSPARQWVLADQLRSKLVPLGFQEAVGYDHRGHQRMVGTIPAANLETLLKDLRWQPGGWFAPNVPIDLVPQPLRATDPILVTEVIPEPPGVPPANNVEKAPSMADDDPRQKVSLDLRALAAREDAPKRERMEVILTMTPGADDTAWQRVLTLISRGLMIEGRSGPVVTVLAPPNQALPLAESPLVANVRLPRPTVSALLPAGDRKVETQAVVRASGLERWHARGCRGKGVRVAIIDSDFRGYEAYTGKQLPAKLRYVDFTAERNINLLPDEFASPEKAVGSGTQAALAVAVAAPEADLTLIRVDPSAPYQLVEAARLINGENVRTEALVQRSNDLQADLDGLRLRREDLNREHSAILNDFRTDDVVARRRQEHLQKAADLERDESALQEREGRLLALLRAYQDLKTIQVVSCNVLWNTGYPVDGSHPLTRYLNDHPLRTTLWFQVAGNTMRQTWADQFRDADGNGVMEFAPPGARLPPDRWTPELNFLGWQPFFKAQTPDLPAKARLRLSIQWREEHDPHLARTAGDVYRKPLANLQLLVLRQRDPTGTLLPADDLEVSARAAGLPQRLDNQPTNAVYEQTVEFTADVAGRYAVRVEGRKAPGTRPPDVPTLPILEQSWELWPRLTVEVLDEPSRQTGRPVFLDCFTARGSLGVPADAQGVITVGAADATGKPQPFSTSGPPLNRDLLVKPDILESDGFRLALTGIAEIYGSHLATPFAAGTSAVVLGAGVQRYQWECYLRRHLGPLSLLP